MKKGEWYFHTSLVNDRPVERDLDLRLSCRIVDSIGDTFKRSVKAPTFSSGNAVMVIFCGGDENLVGFETYLLFNIKY